jgi:Fe-Mn family superoxide dismutase
MFQHITPFPCRPWTLNGLSERLIVSHYENNYGGAIRSANAIRGDLDSLDPAVAPGHLIRALKREELAALDSILLHELYFENLGGDGKIGPAMAAVLDAQFGSVERWRTEFVAAAQSLRGGSGWVALVHSRRGRRLHVHVAVDHTQAMVDAAPLLVLDMYEHAYHIDFGANANAYIDAFLRNIDWAVVERRLDEARGTATTTKPATEAAALPSVSIEELSEELASGAPVQVIDARPKHYYTRSTDLMQGATWRDPTRVAEWSNQLSREAPVVVYCAYGFHVGQGVTAELRERGFDARQVRGGLSAWYAAGGKRALKPANEAASES